MKIPQGRWGPARHSRINDRHVTSPSYLRTSVSSGESSKSVENFIPLFPLRLCQPLKEKWPER